VEDGLKALYVTDLDGTLFNSEKMVSKYSVDIINRFIAQGGLFTIATARMAYECDEKIREITLTVPGIIMNGACLYSFNERKYVDVQAMEQAKVREIEEIFETQNCNAFMYAFEKNALSIFYKTEPDVYETSHLSKQALEECREIRQIDSYTRTARDRQIILFASKGCREKIESVWEKVQAVKGIEASMYTNIYNGQYCLDIFDEKANKANALLRLKRLLAVDEITAFGDNHNDVSMLRIADYCYAPENAVEEVKKMVNGIIESCDDDGVARFIQRKYGL
jgi:Cof subfamily protein (haloacid dehalogenase superfamily)